LIDVETFLTDEYTELEVEIGEVEALLACGDYEVQVTSPDGWVDVVAYVDKGFRHVYEVVCDGNIVVASHDHKFETNKGFVFTRDLDPSIHSIISVNGPCPFVIVDLDKEERVVDLSVNHENHRYYTNNLSSKNTNVGKSLIMNSLAVTQIFQNKKVLYITCEMSPEKIGERILANVFECPVANLKMFDKESFMKKYERVSQFKQKYYLAEYPPKKLTANMIRNLLKDYEVKMGFVPDIIYVDYLALMMPNTVTKTQNSYEAMKIISEELRAVAVDYDVPIVSAVQTGRDGINSSSVDLDDISESIGVAFTADIVTAVTQPDELLAAGKYKWINVKNRYGAKKTYITVLVDYERMRVMYDRDADTSYAERTDQDEYTRPYTTPEKEEKRSKIKDVINESKDESETVKRKKLITWE